MSKTKKGLTEKDSLIFSLRLTRADHERLFTTAHRRSLAEKKQVTMGDVLRSLLRGMR